MNIDVVNLNKLLRLFALPENELIGELRSELRTQRDKADGKKVGGGHFHHPWWEAAKRSVGNPSSLPLETSALVNVVKQRARLYPLLTTSFMKWLEDLRRETNLQMSVELEEAHTHYDVPGLELTVKVDNLLALRLGSDFHRHVYPYFSEGPVLSERWARVGLWLMRCAFGEPLNTRLEILDVLRSRSFSEFVVPLLGNEADIFQRRYHEIVDVYERLRPEYERRAA